MTTSLLTTLLATVAFAQSPPTLRVSMISLGVQDMVRSVQFYGETLGLKISGQPGEVTMFQAGAVMIALNHPLGRASADRMVGAVEIIFPVESVASGHADLSKRGCSFVVAPREVTSGLWAATFTDPDGHRLTILGPK